MIRDVERIVVGGITGVKVRNLDYTAPTIDNPGRLTATFVSETNTLIEPKLSYNAASFIQIGDIGIKMFPVAWRRINSTGENQLEITYEDGSFILDKFFVGLKTKHHEYVGKKNFLYNGRVRGYAEYNENPTNPVGQIPAPFIMLGDYIDPCKDIERDTITDPCSPCPEVVANDAKVDCIKLRSTNILDLDYNFNDLINGIRSKGIFVVLQANYNFNYRTSYVGPLRAVLQSWCSDFGFSYIYNAFGGAGQIIIYDLSSGIPINNKGLESSCTTISMSTENSIQHTSTNGIVAHYAIPGGSRELSCGATFGGRLTLRPLTLRDLVGKAEWEYQEGGPLYGTTTFKQNSLDTYDVLEMLSLLSAYSPDLRDAVAWFDLYNLRTAEDAKKCAETTMNVAGIPGLTIKRGGYLSTSYGDDLKGKHTLPLLKMTIKKVYKQDSTEFNTIVDMSGDELKDLLKSKQQEITDIGGSFKPYFFVASFPAGGQDISDRRNEWEAEIGKNFLGKYFIRKFRSVGNDPPVFTGAGNDSVEFYKQGTESLSFSKLFPYNNAGSYIDELDDKESDKVVQQTDGRSKITDSFLLVTRNTTPVPPMGGVSEYERLVSKAKAFLPIQINPVNSFKPDLKIENPHPYFQQRPAEEKQTWHGEDYIFLGFELPNGLHTQKSSPGQHPVDKKYKTYVEGFLTPIVLGLKETQARYFTVGGKYFWFPPQATVRESQNVSPNFSETGEAGAAGYYVYYRNTMNSSSIIFHPKLELVASSVPFSPHVAKLNISMREFDNRDAQDFLLDDKKNCMPNEPALKAAMARYVENMSSVHAEPHVVQQFEIDGLPNSFYSVLDGLQSLQIRVSPDGVKSFLTFSDFKDNVVERSDEFKEYEYKLNNPYLHLGAHRQLNDIPEVSATNTIPTK